MRARAHVERKGAIYHIHVIDYAKPWKYVKIQYFYMHSSGMVTYALTAKVEKVSNSKLVLQQIKVNMKLPAPNSTEPKKCQDVWRLSFLRLGQTSRVRLLPAASFPISPVWSQGHLALITAP